MTERRISDFQAVHRAWKEGVTSPDEFTPQEEFKRSQEEYLELREAVEKYEQAPTPDNAKEVGAEAVDVIIGMMGVISSLGMDASQLMDEKMGVIFRKYDPKENQQIRKETGLPSQAALRVQKSRYEQRVRRTHPPMA